MKLLIAEDTKDLNRALKTILEHEGYDVTSAFDGLEALYRVRTDSFDALILDIMMPGASGLDVLKELRDTGNITPVLLLTAKSDVDDRVAGLDAGADDYLAKPFAMKELLARLRALTRRRTQYSAQNLNFGDIRLLAEGFELSCESSVRLSIKEFELLQTLILNPGRALTTQYLLEHVWNGEPDAGADTVWLYISYLRGKLRAVSSAAVIDGSHGGSFTLIPGTQADNK